MKKSLSPTSPALRILIGGLCLLALVGIAIIILPRAYFPLTLDPTTGISLDLQQVSLLSLINLTLFLTCGLIDWLALRKAKQDLQRHFASAGIVTALLAGFASLMMIWNLLPLQFPYSELAISLITIPLWLAHTCALQLLPDQTRSVTICRRLTTAATGLATAFFIHIFGARWIYVDWIGMNDFFESIFGAFFILGVLGTMVTVLLSLPKNK